jgi:hypothetical protein
MTVAELLPPNLRVAMRLAHRKSEGGDWCYTCQHSWGDLGCPTERALKAVELLESGRQ